jgi:hypothetical protein
LDPPDPCLANATFLAFVPERTFDCVKWIETRPAWPRAEKAPRERGSEVSDAASERALNVGRRGSQTWLKEGHQKLHPIDAVSQDGTADALNVGRRRIDPFRALARYASMIGITISGKAYSAIAATLRAGAALEREIVPEGEYRVWLPRIAVERLLASREPGETFSDVILRLTERGSFATIIR